jgi:hypothetical protein
MQLAPLRTLLKDGRVGEREIRLREKPGLLRIRSTGLRTDADALVRHAPFMEGSWGDIRQDHRACSFDKGVAERGDRADDVRSLEDEALALTLTLSLRERGSSALGGWE